MPNDELIALTKERIPTIVGYDTRRNVYTIGEEPRLTALSGRGQTTVFNFKPTFGARDKEFNDKRFWFSYPLEGAIDPLRDTKVEVLTAKEAAVKFLQTLFSKVEMPESVIVGEPAVRDDTWKANFRRHIREVFSEVGIQQLDFFPEPFAVFQYYRHFAKLLPLSKQPEIILIIDIGGGTFNSCIIRTTAEGSLARSGATSVPLGLQADVYGGAEIDKALLRIIVNRSKKKGLIWKDDPLVRIEKQGSPALLRVEDAKITLSNLISQMGNVRLMDDFSHIRIDVQIPEGECHPDANVDDTLTGEDLKTVIRQMWQRHYAALVADTVNEASKKLMSAFSNSLERIDKVLVAGGSSQLPFMREEIYKLLSTKLDLENIFIAPDINEAVAYGIACECREQVKRDPKLSVGKIAPCILNDLYLGFRRTRKDSLQIPLIKHNGQSLAKGQLLSSPFETEESILKYELELPFLSDRLFYFFTDKPTNDGGEIEYLNLTHDVFSMPQLSKPLKKCELELEVKPDGMVKPTFYFRGKGDAASKIKKKVDCPEFYFANLRVQEGNAYVGVDFGTSNSYLVKFASIPHEITAAEYPQFSLSRKVKDALRKLEIKIADLREEGVLRNERLARHAKDQALEVIFHSNKLEGSPLTKGETESVLSASEVAVLSEKQREAKNLEVAYEWMLTSFESLFEQPEAFVREINRLIIRGIQPKEGQYRSGSVSLAGVDFEPPQSSSIPAFMRQFADEIQTRGKDRSPLEFSASLHTKLVWIHPFVDGNGRTARLLLNACLLAQGLPVIVVNYADRERYLHCLSESNSGDLSSMVQFFGECFEQALDELATPEELIEDDSPTAAAGIARESLTDEIAEAIREVAPDVTPPVRRLVRVIRKAVRPVDEPPTVIEPPKPQKPTVVRRLTPTAHAEKAVPLEKEDPLTAIMKLKVLELENIKKAEYDAWKQSFLTVSAELNAIGEFFNQNWGEAGFWMKVRGYDILAFEKYDDIRKGKTVTRTWFAGLDISSPQSEQGFMFFFNRVSGRIIQSSGCNRVSLAISRSDGTRFHRLNSEPLNLREITYRDGQLEFWSTDGAIEDGLRTVLSGFLTDIIKSYF